MKLRLKVHYNTIPGQQIYVSGSSKAMGKWELPKAVKMNYSTGGHWSVEISIPDSKTPVEYKYVMQDDHGYADWEWGANRVIASTGKTELVVADDTWRSPSKEERPLYTSAFTRVVMHPGTMEKPAISKAKKRLEFRIQVPRVTTGLQVCVLGNQNKLGNWDKSKPLLLDCGDHFPLWKGSLSLSGIKFPLEYKYGIYDVAKKEVVQIEEGINRFIPEPAIDDTDFVLIKSDEGFRHLSGNWRGAGVAVPVFSLKTKDSFGVGDFKDLIDFIDWAKQTDLKMVQILPINETIASHNWLDSYPYKSISVMALHPMYLSLKAMGKLKDKKLAKQFDELQEKLNDEAHVNYPDVMTWKSKYFKLLFDQEKATFFDQEDYKAFFEANKSWLVPYAAFVYLRDKMKSPDFRKWGKHSTYKKASIAKLCSPTSKAWDDIAIHYFIQYHLDKQMREAAEHAREQGIVLKGDIPIGISPNSVEAWTEPHLFHLDAQAGAPPDDFAVHGQNWGFPTYNWEEMAKEDYTWWKDRLQKMADYFDAYRIDHILGFFRIWEIPLDAVEGTLGYFNPALPLTAKEIQSNGIPFDYERMVKPYIRHHLLHGIFGIHTEEVIHRYLDPDGFGAYKMKAAFDTQKKVNQHFLNDKEEEDLSDKDRQIRDGLFQLIGNVLFIQTGEDEWHPRITLQSTSSFSELDGHIKHQLEELYIQYFYKRHDDFWHEKGMEKLPAIISASDMLVCGEDLGMVPDSVPPVMDQLGILSLEIQRMSKNPKVRFAHPADAPYLSVCTTSTHDMATIRGWWEENRKDIQDFYNDELGNFGPAPFFAEPWVCEQVIVQHLYSPAMWTTFPIQDLIAMDGQFRWNETHLEQINDPSNVRHKWRFRMFQTIEELKKADSFNSLLRNLIARSGR